MVIYRSPDLRHVAARDGDGFVAVLDKQLGGAGMRDDLLHLAEIDQKGAVAADNHRIVMQRFLRLLHRGAKHVGMHLPIAKLPLFYIHKSNICS